MNLFSPGGTMLFSKPYRVLALVLAFALCGVPELLAQTTQPAQQSGQQQPNMTADPSQGPIEPAQTAPEQQQPADQTLPNAPSNSQTGTTTALPDAQTQPAPAAPAAPNGTTQRRPQEPAGTAAAGSSETVGGAASKPAGTAIAPAKQRQVRSLLIKIGAIAAAGAALGIVYGLSKSTSPKPPGATTTTTPPTP
jgi:hypothetical protein